MISLCTNERCVSSFQDQEHGAGRRVFNETKGPLPHLRYGRCSVCRDEKTLGRKEGVKEEKKDA